LVEEQNYSK